MRLLLVNTCGSEGAVALAEERGIVASETLPGRGTSEHLMPAVHRLFACDGARIRDLAAIGVVCGPGSFTGVRVGLSAMKGLCEAGGVPMIAMSRLALVAAAAGETKRDVVAVLDAGRGDFYCGMYRRGVRVSEELLPLAKVQRLMKQASAVTCEARVRETLGGELMLTHEPAAEEMLVIALRRMASGEWSDVATVDANYLRHLDAGLPLQGR